jgi:hypothetical protein
LKPPFIIAAAREVNGNGSLASVNKTWNALQGQGLRLKELVIDPLSAGWDAPIAPDHFRSGCAPVEALAHAERLVRNDQADAILIRGEDLLRSAYAHDKALRQRRMEIYGEDCPLPQAYTLLAHAFMRQHNLTGEDFRQLADALFDNYLRTAAGEENFRPPGAAAFERVTELFRKVDCANPVVDFSGALIVASDDHRANSGVALLAAELAETSGDGPAHVEEIARYDHLRRACAAATARADLDLARDFHSGRALIEAYTCFPVVPLGFLLASGIVDQISDALPLLYTHEITVTGGMNLARAPWNNPALNALIVMFQRLEAGSGEVGIVHGNGGLGYRQGIAILGR